jgi:uncharacterized protein (TIGR02145 family)/gliding motility-associated-like protein
MKKILSYALVLFAFTCKAQIPTEGMVAYYPFNGNANDESGNGNHGTVLGAILSTDRNNNENSAYYFSGNNQYIIVPHSQSLSFSNGSNFSVSFWFESFSSSAQGLLAKSDPFGPIDHGWNILTTNEFTVDFQTNYPCELSISVQSIPPVWHHIVFTIENGTYKGYCDGELQDSIYFSQMSNGSLSNDYPLYIGVERDLSLFLTGKIDDIGVWDRCLTIEEIEGLYNEGQFFSCGDPVTYEGQAYNTVQIGTQCWFKENLNIGSMILSTQDQTNNSSIEKYCYENNPANCDEYGGLYQWNEMMDYAATEGTQGICPDGWHIATDAEWTIMTDFLGGEGVAGGALKEAGTSHWSEPNTGATNASGFTALPGGHRLNDGTFTRVTLTGYYWSSTPFDTNYSWKRDMDHGSDDVDHYNHLFDNSYGFSVRCLKDIDIIELNLPDSIIECFADSIQIDGTAGFKEYHWSTGDTTQMIWVKTNGNYILQVNDYLDNISRDTVYVNLLNFDLFASDTSVCAGESAILEVVIHDQPVDTLPDCLVAYYPFNGNANDESGNGNHGTVEGATLTYDRFNNPESAYSFDGVSNFIKASATLLPTAERTISFWFMTTNPADVSFLGYGGGDCGTSWLLLMNAQACGPNGINAFLYSSHCCRDAFTSPYLSSQVIGWHNIVYTTSEIGTKLYYDSELVYENGSYINYTNTLNKEFLIAAQINLTGEGTFPGSLFFNGQLDDIRIYDCALSGEEIIQLYDPNYNQEVQYTISWSTGENKDSIQVSPTTETTYGVTVADGINSCYKEITIKVSEPDLGFEATPTSGNAPLTVSFDYTGQDDFVRWDFGDGSADSTHSTISHTYNLPGTYYSEVFASSGYPDSCLAFDYIQINVDEEPTIDVPNFFTPNDDGFNDFFLVKSNGMKSMIVEIFDRWGNRIFEITEVDGKWDGLTHGGKEAPEGTYFYYLEAFSQNGNSFQRDGSVFLIRDEVEIYPIPAGNVLNMNLKNKFSGPVEIDIFSVHGMKIRSESFPESETIKIDISDLPGGSYALRIYNSDNQVYTNFIKR